MDVELGQTKASGMATEICKCMSSLFLSFVLFAEVYGTEAILLHLRTPWFPTKHSEECCATLLLRNTFQFFMMVRVFPLLLQAEGRVRGAEGVSYHSADALGGDRT